MSGKKRLTDQMIQRLRAPVNGRLEIGDEACPGLALRVTERGVKSFSVIYKVPGEGGVGPTGRLRRGLQHRITLGGWPILGLKEAREKARLIISSATEGTDPRIERREQNLIRHTNTLEAVVRRFMDQDVKPHVRRWRSVERVFALHIEPHWGRRPLRDIRRSDVHELLDTIIADGKHGTAREVRKHLSKLFNWAVDREIVLDSPMHGLKRNDLRQIEEAGRALTNDELSLVWAATDELGYPYGPLYRLLMLTGQRRNDWASAVRSEVNTQDRWLEVPKVRYKGVRDHIVPLAEPAWQIVEALPVWVGDDYYLFSAGGGKAPVTGFSVAKKKLDGLISARTKRAAGSKTTLQPFRVHDFRVTCETRLATLGFNQEVRDAVLGHAKLGLQKTYNKHDYLDEKRSALADYADYLLRIVTT